ncbi:MAG: aspartate 1-decarboxylase [Candidatus Omnitrophota bacterium]|nr:aspartate 1-decarboxylase [Candidatus Omnitrophota bacterium]MBU2529231.1 aspartate 1-decarboxylase [bacterium]MBU3930505.1 aspartate 1-decarboxylase [bacterium]MBU4122269.1 aspartate 1-decarboxylase [bacterium]
MVLKEVLRAKIQRVKITLTELHYKGSIGLDADIIAKVGIAAGDKVHVLNYDNGERFETYVIAEEAGSNAVILYGPAARKGDPGQDVCIIAYAFVTADERLEPKILNA